jgi:tRNA threonylcarbamoyladenosine biosynthesis protein TsaB
VLILGIDTSGKQGSVALLRAEPGSPPCTLEVAALEGRQYSELLVHTVAGLLARQGAERSAIGLIGVANGPGSFTGLRIAIATVKGLAEAHGTPVVDVSVLEAVALASGAQGKVMAALDAQRTEVFFGTYEVQKAEAQMIREGLATFEGFTSMPGADDAKAGIFTPDETIASRLREAGIAAKILERPSAEAYARIAYRRFCAGIRADTATLDANYLRRSDAEIFATPKTGTTPA